MTKKLNLNEWFKYCLLGLNIYRKFHKESTNKTCYFIEHKILLLISVKEGYFAPNFMFYYKHCNFNNYYTNTQLIFLERLR